jgi:hypothetical protein
MRVSVQTVSYEMKIIQNSFDQQQRTSSAAAFVPSMGLESAIAPQLWQLLLTFIQRR